MSAPPPQKQEVAKKDEAEDLPLIAKIINHVLTPGSSLSGVMLIVFNLIILFLFFIWMMFVYVMPTSWIVWTFGFLGAGLAASTNFLLYQVLFVLDEPPKTEEGDAADKKDNAIELPLASEKHSEVPQALKDTTVQPSETSISADAAKTAEDGSPQREGSVSMRKRKAKKEN